MSTAEVLDPEVMDPEEIGKPIQIVRRGRPRKTQVPEIMNSSESALTIEPNTVGLGKYFRVTPQGLQVFGKPTLEILGDLFELLKVFEQSIAMACGDALNYADSMFGEEAAQLIPEDWSDSTKRVYQWVAAKVAPHNRRLDVLSFAHHQAVAALEPDAQKRWLEKAVVGDGTDPWSAAELHRAIKGIAQAGDPTPALKNEVHVVCESAADVDACCRQLENLGRANYTKIVDGHKIASV